MQKNSNPSCNQSSELALVRTPIGQPDAAQASRERLGLESLILGSPGCAGFDDSPVKRICPGYGQN